MPTPKSTAGQLYLALVEPAVKNWLHARGFVAGDFLGQRNLLDVIRDDAFQRELHTAMHGAAQLDRAPIERLLRGFATLAGVKWTDALRRQAEAASGEVAQIAPYIQRLAPDVWETLHGSQGSVAGLTRAIAESHRYRLSPEAAGELAKQLHTRLTAADKTALRGFSMQDLGKLYQELRRQGRIGDADSPDAISKRLLDYAQPLSAVRDALGTRDIDATLDTFRTIPSEAYQNATLSEVENRIRAGDFLSDHGGTAFSVAAISSGIPESVDLATLTRKDDLLRQQAAASPLANQLAAQERLRAAGGDPGLLRTFMNQTGANQQALTPELIDQVRRQQMAVDLQPQIQQQTNMTGGHPALAAGNLEEVAARTGYQSAAEMQSLHGPAAQSAPDFYNLAMQRGRQAAQVSHLGAHGPMTRIVDTIQNATPQTTGMDVLRAGLNVIPSAQLPKASPMPKMGAEDPSTNRRITPKTRGKRERVEEFDICPHCNEEIGEKATYVDPEGYEYHRPCQDKGPIGFSEMGRKLHALMTRRPDLLGEKEASGDELAFKYWKSRGFSDEVADNLAGRGEDTNTPVGELCPHCGARQEYDPDDQKCNSCAKGYPPEKLADLKEDIAAAVAECETPKSEEQAAAGNYRHGHVTWYGLPISIETGKGMTRSGTSKSGKKWSITMQNSYGYIKRTESEADGDHIDVFLNDDDPEHETVFIVDQVDPETGDFDEHKVLCGFTDPESAKAAYLANYEDGWQGCGGVTEMSLDAFKEWIQDGDTSQPVAQEKQAWLELLLQD